jgi:hypothetical protein
MDTREVSSCFVESIGRTIKEGSVLLAARTKVLNNCSDVKSVETAYLWRIRLMRTLTGAKLAAVVIVVVVGGELGIGFV